jgi:putative DNA primase/helicase
LGEDDMANAIRLTVRHQTEGRPPKVVEFAGDTVTIGRTPDNDLVLDARTVSGTHAKIERVGETYFVEDTDSHFGIFVNKEKVTRTELLPGAELCITPFIIRFDLADPAAEHLMALAALERAEAAGLKVFPVGTDKEPRGAWKPVRAETTDARIRRFQDWRGPRLAAAIPGARYAVVDVDDAEKLSAVAGGTPVEFDGACVLTPSGGRHYWYRNNGATHTETDFGELRTGDGHYVIIPIPGATHAEYVKNDKKIVGEYVWATGESPDFENLPIIPPEVIALFHGTAKAKAAAAPGGGTDTKIPKGKRNSTAARLAGKMHRAGMAPKAIRAALETDFAERAEDPGSLRPGELAGVVSSITSYPREAPVEKPDAVVPLDVAEALVKQTTDEAGNPTLVSWRGEFYLWGGGAFDRKTDGDVDAAVVNHLQGIGLRDKCTSRFLGDVRRCLAGLGNIPADIEPPVFLRPLEHRPDLFVGRTRTLDIGALLRGDSEPTIPNSPRLFALAGADYDYDPEATCPTWQRFIEEVLPDPEARGLFQEFLGLCTVHDARHQKALVMIGEGRNGKGVATLTVQNVLGLPAVSAVGLEQFGRPFALYETLGKLVNISADAPEVDRVAEGVFKAFVAADPLTVERKYRDAFTARPTARLIVACNEFPKFLDRSLGTWRRLLVLRFPVTIAEDREDPLLADKIREERAGVLLWFLEGLRRLRERGHFVEPTACRADKAEQIRMANPARTWLEENVEAAAQADVDAKTLYQKYKADTEAAGLRPLGDPQFGREVRRVFPAVAKARRREFGRTAVYQGIRLIVEG